MDVLVRTVHTADNSSYSVLTLSLLPSFYNFQTRPLNAHATHHTPTDASSSLQSHLSAACVIPSLPLHRNNVAMSKHIYGRQPPDPRYQFVVNMPIISLLAKMRTPRPSYRHLLILTFFCSRLPFRPRTFTAHSTYRTISFPIDVYTSSSSQSFAYSISPLPSLAVPLATSNKALFPIF